MSVTMKLDRAATAVGLAALAIWVGGMVALGACAAPIVFGKVPPPLAGDTMGTIFRRFDVVAMTCAVVVLAVEAVRALLLSGRPSLLDRIRGLGAIAAAACAIYIGVVASPGIMALHEAGAVRGQGEAGMRLEYLHDMAELLGKAEVLLGLAVIVLHVLTLRTQDASVSAKTVTEG